MFATTSPARQNRSFNQDQPTHAAGSRSPASATPRNDFGDRFQAAQRPQTANLDGQREPSSSRSQQGGYFFQPYSSPYVAGKKNNTFVNPNLVSSNVFYDHNYGYKNALPNDRLLSPVRGDVQDNRRNRQDNDAYNRNDRGQGPLTPQKVRRADVSEDRFTRTQGFGPRRLETADENPSRKAQQRSVDSRLPREQEQRKNSGLPQNDRPQRSEKTYYYGEEEQQQPARGGQDRGNEVRAAGARGNKNEAYTIRDDRSEASTVVSTLSSDGYVCPKCLNRHMADGRRTACTAAKKEDQQRERRIQDMNKQFHDDELARQREERARRVQDSRNVKEKLDNEYSSRLENRRSPARDHGGNNLNNLFGKQDEMKERQKAVSDMFRTQLKEQIKSRDEDKEREKRAGSQMYNTSLNIGTGYYNRYLDDPDNVKYKLQEQIEEKAYRQQRERETDKKAAQLLHEQAIRHLEDEDRNKKEKQWNQQRELQDAYWRHSDDKRAKQREHLDNKELERQRTEQDYIEYKRRQQEEEAKTKSRLFDFKQGLMNQMGQSSYKKMYEDRRQQKEATSFDPKSRTKKKYPCGDCSDLYEKPYLTKID